MNRRGFIAAAAAGGTLAGLPALGEAAPTPGPVQPIASYVTNLREAGGVDRMPAAGSRVVLILVSTRAYDPQSIGVATPEGRHLGYLPPVHGRVLAPLIQAGLRFDARVAAARAGRNPELSLEIRPEARMSTS